MRRGRWAKVAQICGYALGVGNLILLVFGWPTILALGFAVVLAPWNDPVAIADYFGKSFNDDGLTRPVSSTQIVSASVGTIQPAPLAFE